MAMWALMVVGGRPDAAQAASTDVDRTAVVDAPVRGPVPVRQDLGRRASKAPGPDSSHDRGVDLSSIAVRLAAGDRLATGELYDATVTHVFAVARALTGDADAAEAVLAATYVEVWRLAPQRFGQADGRVEGVRAWVVHTAAVIAGRRCR